VNAYLSELRKAIKAVHGCDAAHVETVPVKEVFRGEIAWQGDVEVFAVTGHAKAKQCFAWGVRRDDDKGWDITAVLGIPPVVTPELAVKAAIVAHARQVESRRSPENSGESSR
jgi:hypothetical protein